VIEIILAMHVRTIVLFVSEQEKEFGYGGNKSSFLMKTIVFIGNLANNVTQTFPIPRHLPHRLPSPTRTRRRLPKLLL